MLKNSVLHHALPQKGCGLILSYWLRKIIAYLCRISIVSSALFCEGYQGLKVNKPARLKGTETLPTHCSA